MNKEQPIGIFDSGVGGTSIFKQIHELLPMENKIYLADSKNAPYGLRSKEEIIALCFKNTDLLLSRGAKIIVVACNTATTNAIKELRSKYDVPFVGIEPAIKPAASSSTRKCVGVLATKGTLASDLFAQTSKTFAKEIEVIEVEGKNLVEAIEAGQENHPNTLAQLREILKPMLERKIDYLVLGCTHYPYLIPQLEKILPKDVRIIDSGAAVARQTKAILKSMDALSESNKGICEFYTNKNPRILQRFIRGLGFQAEYLDF